MADDNTEVKVKRGEVGFVLNAEMRADDRTLINLSIGGDWTVRISVTARGTSAPNLLEGSTMTLRNQTTRPGQAFYIFTAADATIAAGKYDLEITAVEPNGRVNKFPKIPGSVFGTLHMMEAKA